MVCAKRLARPARKASLAVVVGLSFSIRGTRLIGFATGATRRTGRRVVIIYSFGPNQSRDSSRWEFLGDEIGDYILESPGR